MTTNRLKEAFRRHRGSHGSSRSSADSAASAPASMEDSDGTKINEAAENNNAEVSGAETGAAETVGAEPDGAETGGADTSGAETSGAETGAAETGAAEAGGAEADKTEIGGAEIGGADAVGAGTGEAEKTDKPAGQESDKGKPTTDDKHAEGTVSYLTYKLYISWLDEFSSNIERYNTCLHKYRLILEDNKKNLYHVKVMRILNNWRTYLNESLEFEKYMTRYLKGKAITKCTKCGDYTLCDVPEDHELPTELKTAANACIRWKQLLLEAELLCKGLPAPKPAEASEASKDTPDTGAPAEPDSSPV